MDANFFSWSVALFCKVVTVCILYDYGRICCDERRLKCDAL